MSSTTTPTTFSDLYTDLVNRVRVDTSQTASLTQAKRYINTALRDMHIGWAEKLPWAERSATLITQPKYATGTVDVTVGSTTISGTSTAWNTANDYGVNNMRVGGKIVIDGGVDIYEISAIASDTSATISPKYIGSTDTDLTYVYFEDEYDLASDFLRPFDIQFFDSDMSIEIIDRREFRHRYPRNKNTGKPRVATIFDRTFSGDTSPRRRVAFKDPPDAAYLVPYNYITGNLAVQSDGTEAESLSSDTDEPIVPLRFRHAIVFHALYHWYRDKKNDTRSQEARAEYVDLMARMASDNEIGAAKPKFQPTTKAYMTRSRSPYRRRTSRYVTGDRFDRLR